MVERKSVLLRMSPSLWKELKLLAEQDLRSLNAEIEFLLREAVSRRRGALRPEEDGDKDP